MMSKFAPELRQWLAESFAADRAAAHHLQRLFRLADGAHAVMDAPWPQPPLRDLKAPALAQDHVRRRHADILETDVEMAVRRVVVAIDLHRPDLGHALRIGRHQDHRMLAVLVLAAGLHHHDVDGAARIASARRPPFFAVQYIVVAVALAAQRDVGGVRGSDIRLGHQIGRADFSVEQRLQPLFLLLGRAITLQHFHVAGIGRRAVERFGAEMRLAHLFGQIGIFDRRQAVAGLGAGEPEIPQAAFARLGLEAVQYLASGAA